MRTRLAELLDRFDALAGALAIDATPARPIVHEVARRCGWGARTTAEPLLPSGIRHGVPWGLSMVLGAGAPEVRLFVEAQHDPPSAAAYWAAGRALTAWIATQPGAETRGFEAIAERFVPDERSRFRVWHAVAFRPDEAPRFRVYLCANGAERDLASIETRPGDLVTILSLDLHANGRTKLYRVRESTARDAVPTEVAPDAERLARALLGDTERRLGWLTCFAFREGTPPQVALHLSCERHVDERVVGARITQLATELELDPAPYHEAIAALAPRHHFVSLQRVVSRQRPEGQPRLTIYFLPEVAR